MFFPYAHYRKPDKKVRTEPVNETAIKFTQSDYRKIVPINVPTKLYYIPEESTKKYGCILCNYIVVSPYNKCKHNYCDYCLTSKAHVCIYCI